jgi:hypothetical protein
MLVDLVFKTCYCAACNHLTRQTVPHIYNPVGKKKNLQFKRHLILTNLTLMSPRIAIRGHKEMTTVYTFESCQNLKYLYQIPPSNSLSLTTASVIASIYIMVAPRYTMVRGDVSEETFCGPTGSQFNFAIAETLVWSINYKKYYN